MMWVGPGWDAVRLGLRDGLQCEGVNKVGRLDLKEPSLVYIRQALST
jgi:hypothetical protein